MHPVVYNASMISGIALVSGGLWATHGPGAAAIAAGALVIALTLFGAWVGGR